MEEERKNPKKPYRKIKHTNYYLNTIKGNKFMFLHCLYKTNKEREQKKQIKAIVVFYFTLCLTTNSDDDDDDWSFV